MTEPTDLADRYGAPSAARRAVFIGVVVVLAAALAGWAGWATWSQSTPEVSSKLLSFEVAGEHSAIARVSIDLADGADATCTLRAYADDHTIVGELSFVPTGSGTTEQTVRTEREATSVELLGCTTPDQPRPR